MIASGVVYGITRDQRDEKMAAVRLQLDTTETRPCISMPYEEAGEFVIGQRVVISVYPESVS